MNPVKELGDQRAAIALMDSTRSTIYFGIEPNIEKYLAEFATLKDSLENGDLQPYSPAYNEAIAGVFASDPDYATKLAAIEAAISELHSALQDVLDKIEAVRVLNPLLLPLLTASPL